MNTWLFGYRRVLVVMAVLIGLFSISWSLFAARIEQALQYSLAERFSQHVNGRLEIGNVDLSLIGWVRIADVSLYANKGELLAKVPVVKVQYSWSDLAKGNFDSSRIEAITAEGAEVWLHEEKGQWNWEDFLKKDQTNINKFQGKIQVISAKIYGYTSLVSKTIGEVNGTIDFHAYPDINISLKGKIGQSYLTADGNWANGQFAKIVVQAKDLDLLEFRDGIPASQNITLESGKVPTMTVTTERDDQGAVKWNTEGEFSGLKLTGRVSVKEGQGQFSGNHDELQLKNMKLIISGQQAEGQGTLSWRHNSAMIDAVFTVPDADPGDFVSGLTVQRPVACRIRIFGALAEPDISGSFSFPQAIFSDMTVSGVTGNFQYDDTRLMLQDVSGAVYQGAIWAAGEVQRSNGSYEFEISGQGFDSSRLTDKDVQGLLDFSGHVSGRDETAVVQGTFIIRNGKAYGIPFLTMTGHFVKRGGITEISGIVMKTAVGTFYPEKLSREVLELIDQPGKLKLNEETIKKDAEELKNEANKLIEHIFH